MTNINDDIRDHLGLKPLTQAAAEAMGLDQPLYDQTNPLSREKQLETLLVRAIVELSYIHELVPPLIEAQHHWCAKSAEGEEIVEESMKLLDLPDLHEDRIARYGV